MAGSNQARQEGLQPEDGAAWQAGPQTERAAARWRKLTIWKEELAPGLGEGKVWPAQKPGEEIFPLC